MKFVASFSSATTAGAIGPDTPAAAPANFQPMRTR